VNASFSTGLAGRGVLALHRDGMSRGLLTRLIDLGLDPSKTFPIQIETAGGASEDILKANIYHLAAIEGDLRLLKILPRDTSLINAQAASGETPLIAGVKYCAHPKVVAQLIRTLGAFGADLALRDASNRHAFHYSLQHHSSAVLTSLLKVWADKKIVPVNKFEARSGLAYALLSPPLTAPQNLQKLGNLIVNAPDNSPLKGAPVHGIMAKLEDALPKPSEQGGERKPSPSNPRESGNGPEKKLLQLKSALIRLAFHAPVIGRAVTAHLIDSPLPTSKLPLLSAAYRAGVGPHVLKTIINLGGSPDHRFDGVGRSSVEVLGGTLLHHAINDGRIEVQQLLLNQHPELAMVVDKRGNTPLHTHLQAYLARRRIAVADVNLIDDLIRAQCPTDTTNDDGIRPVDLAIQLGDLDTLAILDRNGAKRPLRDSSPTFEVMNLKRKSIAVDYSGLLKIALKWRQSLLLLESDELASMLTDDAALVLRQSKSVYSAYLTLVAGADVINESRAFRKGAEAGRSLVKLAPSLLFHQPPHTLWGIWNAIDWMSDNYRSIQRLKHHFNEAEMMLLLNHPKQGQFDSSELDPLTRAITATRRVADYGLMTIPHSTVWNLARIGLYTHGFHLSLKHDAEPSLAFRSEHGWVKVGPSLLERRLGMVRIGKRHTDGVFGPVFLMFASADQPLRARLLRRSAGGGSVGASDGSTHQWYTLLPDTMMEFRRGYTLVSNPVFGTLLIRNSSLIFGRDGLRHAAYWMSEGYRHGYSYDDLLSMDRYLIEKRMRHVLAPSVIGNRHATNSIYQLLRQLDIVRDFNRRVKFESQGLEAFEKDDSRSGYRLSSIGGYRAPGFPAIVDFLRQRYQGARREIKERGTTTKEIPDLAFAMPWFPPWVTFRFAGENGEMRSRLKVNKDVLAVLNAFASDTFTQEISELDNHYGVSRFFQEAGFNNNAELIMLSPKD
jgi:ankyrin repeat protein